MSVSYLDIGGVVALGFDPTGRHLLVVSHSGHGVFDTTSWQRVASDLTLAYPDEGVAEGIGPLAGQRIPITELDYSTGTLHVRSPHGDYELSYESGTVTIQPIAP